MKVWLVWYMSPEESEPDNEQLEGVYLNEANARASSAARSHWGRVEVRDVEDAPGDATVLHSGQLVRVRGL